MIGLLREPRIGGGEGLSPSKKKKPLSFSNEECACLHEKSGRLSSDREEEGEGRRVISSGAEGGDVLLLVGQCKGK